jgi:hypothetical protein
VFQEDSLSEASVVLGFSKSDSHRDIETMFSRSRSQIGGNVCLIAVHAGAGYHSFENEKKHLQACRE